MKKLFSQSFPWAVKAPSKSALIAVALIGIMSFHPALAQDWRGGHPVGRPAPVYDRGHDRDWDRHAHMAHDWRWRHSRPESGVVYAPPAVIYAPPPQPSGINLILPLNFR